MYAYVVLFCYFSFPSVNHLITQNRFEKEIAVVSYRRRLSFCGPSRNRMRVFALPFPIFGLFCFSWIGSHYYYALWWFCVWTRVSNSKMNESFEGHRIKISSSASTKKREPQNHHKNRTICKSDGQFRK